MKLWPKLNLSAFTPRGLFTRSLLIIIVPMLILLLTVTYVFFDRHWEAVTRRLADAVALEISLVVQFMEESPATQKHEFLELARRNTTFAMTLEPLSKPNPERGRTLLTRMVGSSVKSIIPYQTRTQLAPNGEDIEVSIRMPTERLKVIVPKRRVYTATTYVFVMWLFGAAFIMVTIAILFMRNQIRPIKRLAAASESFGRNIDLPGFKPEGAREVRRAAQAFINMRERIKRQIAQRTEMLAGVSHDLRTPLTRMKLQLAMMKEQKGIAELQSDIEEMEHMINAYLDFVRGEGGEPNSDFDLKVLVEDCVEQAKRFQTDTILIYEEFPSIPFTGRRQALQRCIMNLITNAQRYAQTIQVTMALQTPFIVIRVEDNGPGIPEDQHENVFQAFYRLDTARNLNQGGSGLGLTIARDIARSHGGDIVLSGSEMGGLCAAIALPV